VGVLGLAFSLCLQEAVIVGLEERGKYVQGMVPKVIIYHGKM
jgi:hypothetical protein